MVDGVLLAGNRLVEVGGLVDVDLLLTFDGVVTLVVLLDALVV